MSTAVNCTSGCTATTLAQIEWDGVLWQTGTTAAFVYRCRSAQPHMMIISAVCVCLSGGVKKEGREHWQSHSIARAAGLARRAAAVVLV